MLSVQIDHTLANIPPDKVSIKPQPQQIDEQHLLSDGFNHDFESDVAGVRADSLVVPGLCHVADTFSFLENWRPPLLHFCGIPTFRDTPSLIAGYSDSELSLSSDPDATSPEADPADYKLKEEEFFVLDEVTHTASGTPSMPLQLQDLDFSCGLHAFAKSFPFHSHHIQPAAGYRSPLQWQHMDGAATANVRCPSSHHKYPVVASFPPTNSHSTIEIFQKEVISHINTGVPWSPYDAGHSVDQERTTLFPVSAGINPSLLNMSIPASYHGESEAALYGQRQLQEHYYHIAPAGALDMMGSGMRVPMHPNDIPLSSESLLAHQHTTGSVHSTVGPRKSTGEAHNNVPSKKSGTTGTVKNKRKQSTEKVFPCTWPGCKSGKPAIIAALV